ncbi:hypothetical protein KDL45_05820, partial [bacterium]|nr:hypothetical protein [bacterium]
MMPESDASIAEVIRRFGLLPDEDLQSAQDAADRDGRALADSLVHGELITPDQLTWVRSQVYGLPFVHVDPTAIDVELVREFPPALLRRSKAIPLLKLDSEISFAVADPGDEEMIKDLQFACGGPVSLNLGGEENIRLALDAILEDGDDAGEDDEDEAPIKLEFDPTAFSADDDSGVAAVFFNLMSAVQNGATEVLFRAEAEGLGIHHRIGGILARKETLEGEAASAILPKIKSLAGLTEPAEGEVTSRRLTLNLFGQNYELNFLMIPVGVQHDVAVHLRRASALEAPSDDEAVAEPPVEFVDAFAELMRERSGLVVFAADDFETAFDLMTAAWAEEDGEREIVAVTSERTEAPVPVHRHHPPQGHAHVDTVLDALTPDVAILDQINHPDLAVPLNWIGPGRMVVVITPIDEALRN